MLDVWTQHHTREAVDPFKEDLVSASHTPTALWSNTAGDSLTPMNGVKPPAKIRKPFCIAFGQRFAARAAATQNHSSRRLVFGQRRRAKLVAPRGAGRNDRVGQRRGRNSQIVAEIAHHTLRLDLVVCIGLGLPAVARTTDFPPMAETRLQAAALAQQRMPPQEANAPARIKAAMK